MESKEERELSKITESQFKQFLEGIVALLEQFDLVKEERRVKRLFLKKKAVASGEVSAAVITTTSLVTIKEKEFLAMILNFIKRIEKTFRKENNNEKGEIEKMIISSFLPIVKKILS
jgi:hypothetical protein